jgi:hypothetical protein
MKVLVFLLAVSSCSAQIKTLQVFSEFTRVDPFGNIVPQDKGTAEPRHILSPGFPRNGWSSLRIVATFDKPTAYSLDIGQNPENAVKVTLYKEVFEKHGDQWYPDRLEQVKVPYEAVFAEAIPGQKVVTFWLDMWVDAKAPVDRIKVEPQLWVSYAEDWFTYPMEVRILESVLPNVSVAGAELPPVTARTDAAAMGPLRAAVCGIKETPVPTALNARAMIRRNVMQHMAARHPMRTPRLLKLTGAATPEAWCSSKAQPTVGPEWYLRLRDAMFQ